MGEDALDAAGFLTPAAALWARHLGGLKERDVLEAIDHFAKTRVWPPSLAEIRMHALGIPSLDQVRHDVGKRELGFTRLLWAHLDVYAFTRADTQTAERILRSAYDYALELRLNGTDYPTKLEAITQEQRPVVVADPAVVLKARQALYGDQAISGENGNVE